MIAWSLLLQVTTACVNNLDHRGVLFDGGQNVALDPRLKCGHAGVDAGQIFCAARGRAPRDDTSLVEFALEGGKHWPARVAVA